MSLHALRDHYERYLGAITASETLGEMELVQCERPEFTTIATLGLSQERITVVYPQELLCSVKSEQAGAANIIIRGVLDVVESSGRGMVHQNLISNPEPLLTGTDIHGVLVAAHPYLDDEFNVLFGPGREVLVDLMTLIPITGAEAQYARTRGPEALLDALEAANPDLADVTRPSAV
jgi:hypothetical protein